MHESSKNVQACLADMYEPDWYGKNEVDSIVEVRRTFIDGTDVMAFPQKSILDLWIGSIVTVSHLFVPSSILSK